LPAARAQESSRTFPETGKSVSGRFLRYWDEHGGLAQQGYSISDELQERSEVDGKTYTVQYFERAVFEAHPENRAPYDVLLTLLGTLLFREKYPNGVPGNPTAHTLPADKAPAASCPPTFADDRSPTYKPGMPVRNSVGKGDTVTGYVLSSEGCRPIAGAKLEMWPEVGGNHPDEYRATLFTDAEGRYRFESPVPDHIHMHISAHGYTAIFSNAYHPQEDQPEGTFNVVLRPDPGCTIYEPTGNAVCGTFLEYWKSHGGLAQQGYPISGDFTETSDLNGKTYTVQYFERAVFEAHPENKAPYDVLLSQLGTYRFESRYRGSSPGAATATPVPDAWAALRQKPLHVPTVEPGAPCPVTPSKPIVPAPPVRMTADRGMGDGPVYAVAYYFSEGTTLQLRSDMERAPGWFTTKVRWVGGPDYVGPVLVRGRRIDGEGEVRFEFDDPNGRRATSPEMALEAFRGWNDWPSSTLLPAPGAGCYAYQVDGTSFTEVIVFRALLEP
jgi:hypothetical protein